MKWTKFLSGIALISALGLGVAACSSNNVTNSSEKSAQPSNKSSAKSSSTSSVNESKAEKENAAIKLNQDEAVAQFKKKFAKSKIKSIELQSDGTKYIYQIEGFDTEYEHELTLDSESGKVLHAYSGRLESDERHEKGLDLAKLINRTQASKIAQSRVRGSAIEWKLEMDDGQPVWDVTVENGSQRSEVKINAESKHVLEVEHDN